MLALAFPQSQHSQKVFWKPHPEILAPQWDRQGAVEEAEKSLLSKQAEERGQFSIRWCPLLERSTWGEH